MHLRDPQSPVFPAWDKSSAAGTGRRTRHRTRFRKEAVTATDLVPLVETSPATRRKSVDQVYTAEQSRVVVSESSAEARIELKVLLPQITTEQLRQRGALRGISGSTLASELLVTIARDSLYDAVLDGG